MRTGGRLLAVVVLAASAAVSAGQGSRPVRAGGLELQVVETARSVDLRRGGERFLVVTLEVAGDRTALRSVQPLRGDFTLTAGARSLPCRWLRGGSLPEDPERLRFTLGFTYPAGAERASLRVSLPGPRGRDTRTLFLAGLRPGTADQSFRGPEWALTVTGLAEQAYEPPLLPEKGFLFSKGGPVDVRVFRKEAPGSPPPARCYRLTFQSTSLGLYDPVLDLSGTLRAGRHSTPLLAARLLRDPSQAVKDPPYGPFVRGEFYFGVPPEGLPTGAEIRLTLRPAGAATPIVLPDLPVP